jgi:hypothetical protein
MITSEEIRKEFLELGYIELEPNKYRTCRDEYLFDITDYTCIVRVWTLQGELKINRINGLYLNKIEDLRFIINNIV